MYHIKRIALVLVALWSLSACSNDKSVQLCRTWRIEDLKYTTEIPPQLKAGVDNWVKEMKTNFSITYLKDGTYHTYLSNQKLVGQWKLNWNSSVLTATAHDGTVKKFHIKELTDSRFEFDAEEGGEKVIFVMVPGKLNL